MDSIEKEILNYYLKQGTLEVKRIEQDCNDFEKALKYLLSLQSTSKYIIIYGAFGQRFDHEIQAFNILRKFLFQTNKDIIFISHDNWAIALRPGIHNIHCSKIQGPTCGLLPLYNSVKVSTKGFRWNLNETVLEFGNIISSSNEIIENPLTIENDAVFIFHTIVKAHN